MRVALNTQNPLAQMHALHTLNGLDLAFIWPFDSR